MAHITIIGIGEVTRIFHCCPETVRRWEKSGVLVPIARLANGQRLYDRAAVETLAASRTTTTEKSA